MNRARLDTVPLCAGCRAERATALKRVPRLAGLALHDECCACYVIVPTRPRYGTMHVHPPEEPRPWLTGARGGRFDVPPANTPRQLKVITGGKKA